MSLKSAIATIQTKETQLVAGTPQTLKAAMTVETILQSVALAFHENPKLAKCTDLSVYFSVLYLVRLGLEIGGHAQQAWLVPFKDQCTPMVGVQGKIELAARSGKVARILVGVFCEHDEYDFDLGDGSLSHKLDLRAKTRGDPVGAWCRIWLTTHPDPVLEVMPIADFLKIQDDIVARTGKLSAAHKNWPGEMFKRSVISRALKRVPKSKDLAKMLSDEWRLDRGARVNEDSDVIDASWDEPKAIPEDAPDFERKATESKRKPEPVPVKRDTDDDGQQNIGGMPS